VTEPPNTEALLATVREALEDAIEVFPDTKWFEAYYESPAALDTIASELERVRAERDEARQLYIDDECPSHEFLVARGWIEESE
jgi:hypothetical protein